MNKEQIVKKIKETEEQLAKLRAELEKPEYPSLESSKAGDKLKDGCIVVHKFEETKMALIAAPKNTIITSPWKRDFHQDLIILRKQFPDTWRHRWFIPSASELELAYKNCPERFYDRSYWTSDRCVNDVFMGLKENLFYYFDFSIGFCGYGVSSRNNVNVRAFRLISY
jgi:hypothetical protein